MAGTLKALDLTGREIKEGDTIAYATSGHGQGSSPSAQLSIGRVLEVYDGTDRWKRPAACLKIKVERSSRGGVPQRPVRTWMTEKAVVLR